LWAIRRHMKKKVEKEVKVINVTRPEENQDSGDSGSDTRIAGDGRTEFISDSGVKKKRFKRWFKRRRKLQMESDRTDGIDELKSGEDNEGSESIRSSVPPFQPYES